ncbi:phage regulatory CII family protein [Mailhella massiliensis]|nr:phage regulatory CII family protein [Mailhella massiliensis]
MLFHDFSMLVQDVVVSAPCGVQMLARRVGKTYPTLMREVNPYDKGAKLGADTLLNIMLVSRDVRPLEYMAQLMGLRLERMPGKEEGE